MEILRCNLFIIVILLVVSLPKTSGFTTKCDTIPNCAYCDD
jgi:hypothetical protein